MKPLCKENVASGVLLKKYIQKSVSNRKSAFNGCLSSFRESVVRERESPERDEDMALVKYQDQDF